MIFRSASAADGLEMLRLIESHSTNGGMKLLYTRRQDAYQSYLTECPDAEITLGVEDEHVLAQVVCLPRKVYLNGAAESIGYVTGLHREDGTSVNLLRLLETARKRSSVKQFFCSILNENQAVYELFAKRGLIQLVSEYTTYIFNPSAPKAAKLYSQFRRARPEDTERLLHFYKNIGSNYSFSPSFETLDRFAGLSISDFFLLEKNEEIIAAGALWDQRIFKQYIALGYHGAYNIAAHCNPLLRLLKYPPLPKINTTANFAYISFLHSREDNIDTFGSFLKEIAAQAREYDFLTIGSVKGDTLDKALGEIKSIRIGSKICNIIHKKNSGQQQYKKPFRFECALL